MGRALKRINPKIRNEVERNLDEFFITALVSVIRSVGLPWQPNKRGRPSWDPRVLIAALVIRELFSRTYSRTEAYLKANPLFKEKFGLERTPGSSVLQRAMRKVTMKYLRKVIRRLIMRYRRKGMTLAVDSTGIRLKTSSHWFDIRIRRISKRKDHMKLHIVVDVDTGIILSFAGTDWKVNDGKQLKGLLRELSKFEKMLGDKAYSSRVNYTLVHEKGARAYFLFKENVSARAKGSKHWHIQVKTFFSDRDAWMKEYHMRSFVEAVFSSIKRFIGSIVRSKKKSLKKRELALKVLAYNLWRVLLIDTAENEGVPLWVTCK